VNRAAPWVETRRRRRDARATALFHYIERSLDETERELDERLESRPLRDARSDLTPNERGHLRQSISKAREILACVADRFALDAPSMDLRRSIASRFSLLAIDAVSATSKALRAYGPIDDELRYVLDPLIETLVRALEAVVRAAAGSASPEKKP
jgi:hypothetical protein